MSGNYWWYITLFASAERQDVLHSLAELTGSIGAELQELPTGARLRAYYLSAKPLSCWRDRMADALREWDDIRIEDMGRVDNQQWHVANEESFPPLPVGDRLVVLAPWHRGKEPADRVALYINPGSAFGTGYHESTQIALELLEKYIEKGQEKMTVVDVGTGSGILSIAALKLGASRAVARDIDPAVMGEVSNNCRLNGIEPEAIELSIGDGLHSVRDASADLLLSNILIEPNLQVLSDARRVLAARGVALFSGMIRAERDPFCEAIARNGLVVLEERQKEDWWGVAATPAP